MKLIPLAFGIFDINEISKKKIFSDQIPKGYFYNYSPDPVIIHHTSKIPLHKNTAFGVRFIIEGSQTDKHVLNIKILHPEIENTELFTFTETSYFKEVKDNLVYTELYFFEEKWEMVPGFWTFQCWIKNILLLEKEFELYTLKEEEDVEEKFFFDM